MHLRVVALCAAVALGLQASPSAGHGMLVHPTPRNARDAGLEMFKNGSWPSSTDGCE